MSRPLDVLIADDEPLAREKLRDLIADDPSLRLVAECANGREAVEAIRAARPGLVILDVQMPELDGFGVVAEVGVDAMPTTIFVTAFDQYALRAFEAQALDYLLKPYDADRFAAAVARARRLAALQEGGTVPERLVALLEEAAAREQYPPRFMVKEGVRYVFVRPDEIDWVEAARNYVTLHSGKRAFLLRETMDRMERLLDPRRFLRVRRSAIVNLERVRAVEPWSATEYVITLAEGARVTSARRYRHRIRALMLR
ncbi:MAG TPA: LytTR family DNA-binding domain-containing protein [Longimicrobium sp.]|nr:LytTR family DNA-binding domain-containing protein [Longimicrobium sp.]